MLHKTTRTAARWVPAATLAFLAACGGSEPSPTANPTADASVRATADLLADDGTVNASNPAATPADPGARTRAGRYASAEQARRLEERLGAGVISTDTDTATDDITAVDLAVMMVWGQQAAHGLDQHTPVLVRGRNLRLAAAAAERLSEQGHTRVFLVTP